MTMQRHKVTNKPTLSAEQIERLQALDAMPDSQIDYSDIPQSTDWSGAIKGSVVSTHHPVENEMLEADVAQWLSAQDAQTKRHINEVIRHIMVLQQV